MENLDSLVRKANNPLLAELEVKTQLIKQIEGRDKNVIQQLAVCKAVLKTPRMYFEAKTAMKRFKDKKSIQSLNEYHRKILEQKKAVLFENQGVQNLDLVHREIVPEKDEEEESDVSINFFNNVAGLVLSKYGEPLQF